MVHGAWRVQVIVYIPSGGQLTTQIDALTPDGEWVPLFMADEREVDVSVTALTKFKFVTFSADTCRTIFTTDTIRVTLDASLTQEFLEVRAL